jgi:hypothetical protein
VHRSNIVFGKFSPSTIDTKGISMMHQLPIGAGLLMMALLAIFLYVPNRFRNTIFDTFKIRLNRFKKSVTPPIERELAMVAGPQKVIDESLSQVQDLRGTLVHESNVLMQREDDLATAEAQYYKAVDDKSDTGIDELVMLVGEKEQDVALQTKVVDGVKEAVSTACKAVDKARKELRRVQMTIKSDVAIAKATEALNAAAQVMEAARSMTVNGGALKEASNEVSRDFAAARARVDVFGEGSVDRELRQLDETSQIAELRKRLDAKRPVAEASAKSQS